MSANHKNQSPASGESRPPNTLPSGTRLRDEYRIGGILGTGSFGITYRARDEYLDTDVAIKEYYPRQLAGRGSDGCTVQPYTDADADAFEFGREKFMQEGRVLARFAHPNVVKVHSYFEENGTGYLVMDYYEGQSLATYLSAQAGKVLPEEEALGLMGDVLSGLQAVHREGVLHRDIDPNNIYRTESGKAVLIDFGAAREAVGTQSRHLTVLLKPGYAPIEQYKPDGDQGPWTDVYACAATLWKCLTGCTPPDALARQENDEFVSPKKMRPAVSSQTSTAIEVAMSVSPAERPASAEEFASLLSLSSPSDPAASISAQAEAGPAAKPSSVIDHRAAADFSMSAGPTDANVTDAAPTEAAPTEAAPTEAAPTEAAPTEAAPTEIRTTEASITETPSPVEAERSADSSATSATVPASFALMAGAIGVVGGTLALNDAPAIEVVSFFGTWLAVCLGLITLFREGEKVMSPEGRAAVSDWLLQESFTDTAANWPQTFVALFDAVFTGDHRSWTCFLRSALTSVVIVTLLLGGFMGFGLLDDFAPDSLFDVSALSVLALPVVLNVFIDYISLSETRWILGKMSRSNTAYQHILYLAVDLTLTLLCCLVPIAVVQIAVAVPVGDVSVGSAVFWDEAIQELVELGQVMLRFEDDDARLLSIMLFSTLFTSVWVWLYVSAGLLLRGLQPLVESLEWLKRHVDVETRPIHAMGVLLAVLTSAGFAFSAPLAL